MGGGRRIEEGRADFLGQLVIGTPCEHDSYIPPQPVGFDGGPSTTLYAERFTALYLLDE